MESEGAPPIPTQLVGNVFVEQYYLILHESPEGVYRFYQDSSVLSRPGPDGVMTTVTTMQGINDMILSLGYQDFKVEILTADAQASYKDGVIVLVTGCLTGKDNVRRKFTQSFFLAPQEKGYFVLNDVFRYVDENESQWVDDTTVNVVDDNAAMAPLPPDAEPAHIPDHPTLNHTTDPVEDTENSEVSKQLDNEVGSVIVKEVVSGPPVDSIQNDVQPIIENTPNAHADAPKKTYASIVKVNPPVSVSASTVRAAPTRVAPARTEQKLRAPAAPEASAPGSNVPTSNINQAEVRGRSIHIRNLPLTATVEEVEGVFKRFGPIKKRGVQVRSYRYEGYCFGFVEFESPSSVKSAVEASPITIGGIQATIEEKRTSAQVGSGRGRFPSGRGGFRNENGRGRGNFGGGRGYGNDNARTESGNREIQGRTRGPGREGEAYQKVYQNGNGRVVRQPAKLG